MTGRRRVLGGEPLAALGPPALQDRPAGTRRHPGTESVLALPPAHIRLIGPFHRRKRRSERPFCNYSRADSRVAVVHSPRRLSGAEGNSARKAAARCCQQRESSGIHTCGELWGRVRKRPANHAKTVHGESGCRTPLSGPGHVGMLARAFQATGGGGRKVGAWSSMTSDALWSEVTSRLKSALNDSAYRTWFGEARAVADLQRRARRRRSEQLHARVDRDALRQPRPRRRQRRERLRAVRPLPRRRVALPARRRPRQRRPGRARRSRA